MWKKPDGPIAEARLQFPEHGSAEQLVGPPSAMNKYRLATSANGGKRLTFAKRGLQDLGLSVRCVIIGRNSRVDINLMTEAAMLMIGVLGGTGAKEWLMHQPKIARSARTLTIAWTIADASQFFSGR